jgi:1L-myo-inositol 1-phosphate cytidylyltransferase
MTNILSLSYKWRVKEAVILAAGFGSRLSGHPDNHLEIKPLVHVAGDALIAHICRALMWNGIERIVFVLGHKGEILQRYLESRIDLSVEKVFVYNDEYDKSNGVSVLAAKEAIKGPFVLSMSDHLMESSIIDTAINAYVPTNGLTLCVDRKLDEIFDFDDVTKVKTSNDHIVDIGKEIQTFDCYDTGIFHCTAGLFDALGKVYRKNGDCSLSDGVNALSSQGRAAVADIGSAWWQDVDTPDTVDYAEEILAVHDKLSATS